MPLRGHVQLVWRLELDIRRVPVCLACLSFVSFPLDDGKFAEAKREARKLAPDIWAEGLAEPALEAVRRACEAGVPGADEALADLERLGGRSKVAQELVLRLADDLNRWSKEAPPELN